MRDLKRDSFKLGDDKAASFTYIDEPPINEIYNATVQELASAAS
jgi:hypothetical protein